MVASSGASDDGSGDVTSDGFVGAGGSASVEDGRAVTGEAGEAYEGCGINEGSNSVSSMYLAFFSHVVPVGNEARCLWVAASAGWQDGMHKFSV